MLALVLLGAATALVAAIAHSDDPSADPDPLLEFRGTPVVLEFPDLADVGRTRAVPRGWRYVQVTTDMYDVLAAHLPDGTTEALVYFDRHGNRVLRDVRAERIARIRTSVSEAERRIAGWERTLASEWEASREARAGGKPSAELEHLVAVLSPGLRGYAPVEAALARRSELDDERLGALWILLAREGLVDRSDLTQALEDLLEISLGLDVEMRIRVELERIERGWVVQRRGSGG